MPCGTSRTPTRRRRLTPAAWPRVRDELRATAYFVLGRVAATRGAYADARRSLLMALSLNHEEIDALYTLGVVQMALGDDNGAAPSFAHVMQTQGPLARAARESLTVLYARGPNASASFDTYVSSLRWTPPNAPVRAPSPVGRHAMPARRRAANAMPDLPAVAIDRHVEDVPRHIAPPT